MFSNKLDEMSICTKKKFVRIPAGTKIIRLYIQMYMKVISLLRQN